jgi:tRNA(Arg) A34 adenosine deaminase TadA
MTDDPPFRRRAIAFELPAWTDAVLCAADGYPDDEARMRLAIRLARENVIRGTGGPFGAAIFEAETGRLAGAGVNLVVPARNSTLHAEIVAFMTAQASVESYTLAAPGLPVHELYTSCEPCAMCLGATLWSGVQRVVWAATREDADRLSFDEGPVFAASYKYLRRRGIRFTPEVLRGEAQEVFSLYGAGGGEIYNA